MKLRSAFVLSMFAVALAAQNDMSWVSAARGNDGNPCTLASPCKTFQRAHNVTNGGGIVKAMDAGEYGTVNITKTITIDGNGVGASIEATSTLGAAVNAASGLAEIRNLSIHVPCQCDGIDAVNAILMIENVTITGTPQNGVFVSGNPAAIHGLSVFNASTGIAILNAGAIISDSLVREANTGIVVNAGTALSRVMIERTKMVQNTVGLSVVTTLTSPATAWISECVIAGNQIGVQTSGSGQIITFRNNTWADNSTDGSTPFSTSLK